MATSRTGTALHKRMVRTVMAEAQARGVTHCPACKVELDYVNRTAPNGAHADEIVPFAVRGETSSDPNDWQVLCATCNQSKGAKGWDATNGQAPYPTLIAW